MQVLVAYESRKGTTARVAERIGLVAQGTTPFVTVARVADVTAEQVEGADVLFVGSWVSGLIVARVGPAPAAAAFVRDLPPLAGTLVGVFCTYDVNPRATLSKLATPLAHGGADIAGGIATKHRNPLQGVDGWVRAVMATARERERAG